MEVALAFSILLINAVVWLLHSLPIICAINKLPNYLHVHLKFCKLLNSHCCIDRFKKPKLLVSSHWLLIYKDIEEIETYMYI